MSYCCRNFEKHQQVYYAQADQFTGQAPRCQYCGNSMTPTPVGDPNQFNPVNARAEEQKDPRDPTDQNLADTSRGSPDALIRE